MAGLTISGATVGYDKKGVKQLMNDVHAKVIQDAAKKMSSSLKNLDTAVDEIWKGTSATVFKANMKKDVTSIKNAMEQAYNVLNSEMNALVNAMGSLDQQLVKKR